LYQWDTPYPGEGAAAQILARQQNLSRALTSESLLSVLATPGERVDFGFPGEVIQTARVQAVGWNLPNATTRFVPRDLGDLGLLPGFIPGPNAIPGPKYTD